MDYKNAFAIIKENSDKISFHLHLNYPTTSRSDWNVLLKYLLQTTCIGTLACFCHYAAMV